MFHMTEVRTDMCNQTLKLGAIGILYFRPSVLSVVVVLESLAVGSLYDHRS